MSLKRLLQSAITLAPPNQPFKMASGGTSDTMLDLSKVLRTQDGQLALLDHLKTLPHEDFDSAGGPLCGSDLVCAALSQAWNIPRWFGVRKEMKGRGYDKGFVSGDLRQGDKVVLVEDVCTTGGNLLRVSSSITAWGAEIAHILVVVDRGGLANVQAVFTKVPTTTLFTLQDLQAT